MASSPVMMAYKDVISTSEYTDTDTLGTGLIITQPSIGVASTWTGFTGVDGILSIGPLDLTQTT